MFHVPPERYRVLDGPMGSDPGIPAGAFVVDSCEAGWSLVLIADDGRAPGHETDWEHVSVRAESRRRSRIPTWREMAQIKDLCWDDDDVVVQFHPAKSEYVNQHPHVLHLWRPVRDPLPVPPRRLV
jgi:hypothetical protein